VQNPSAKLDANTWFNGDQLSFDSGSAQLKPGAQTELNNIASILASCPNVRMTIAGYTDNVGNPEANLRLSRSRANAVVAQLTDRGVNSGRLATEGYGEQYPVADNSTSDGRAQNRRVAMCVTQK
jgi:outer membrane protein OmpA-like peptidoglycan-associated protein